MAYTHVGTKYIKRQQDFENFLKFRHTLKTIIWDWEDPWDMIALTVPEEMGHLSLEISE